VADPSATIMADAGKEYLDSQGVQDALKVAVSSVIREKPANAILRTGELLVAAAKPKPMDPKPTINYFAICGRGELARLICAVGEIEFEDKAWAPAFDDTGGWRQGYQSIGKEFGFPGTLPILEHGDVKLFETTAIEGYLASLAPKFAVRTSAQLGKDLMFQCIKADINVPTENLLFKKITADELTPILEKTYAMIEGLLPEKGFINGLEYPTPADLAVMVISAGCMPFQAAPRVAGFTFPGKYPKMDRITAACMSYPAVAKYLATSEHKTLKADPFGIMPPEYASYGGPFSFASGLPDCCTASPELYKTIAEIPGVARLVEMSFPPGAKDTPHEHPVHSMYFVTDAKLKISGPPTPTVLGEEGGVAEIPAGAAPIFPAMAHQVENVGDKEGKAIFVEAYPGCKPCGDIEGYISPFAVAPGCYKILAEDDDWITGVLTMKVGEEDAFHHHKDHLIYVLEGNEVTIYPGGDKAAAMAVPIAPFAGIPAPMAAPPFGSHILKNSGTKPIKMIFFEAKK